MRINTNLMAINSQRNLDVNQNELGGVMEKLSSGLRINRAGDDAAGLAISEKMRNQIKGLYQAGRNAQDGISLIQTAEGALAENHEMLKRMREMAIQAMNDTYTNEDRKKLNLEAQQLITEVDELAVKAEFNEQKLLTGDPTGKGLAAVANKRELLASALANYYIKVGSYESKLGSAYAIEASTKMEQVAQSVLDLEEKISALEVKASGEKPAAAQLVLKDVSHLRIILAQRNASIAAMESSATTLKESAAILQASAFYIEATSVTDAAKQLQATMNEQVGPHEFTLQVGANNGQTINLSIKAMNATALGLSATKIDSPESSGIALSSIDAAVEIVSRQRAELGAVQNRLEHTVKNLNNTAENLQSAESQIRDTDMAAEMVFFTRTNILSQASQAMLAQANQIPEQVLQLLN
ncbi:flagellin [Candidatus Epulonipiscium viviparus]|uniref:flagellin N-terminal helical domain-containing protein n=1 Tax=Candidatus Epulonipiscium viviparus TaxID=420336 RepID=UPI00016BFF52|nr:flagellin [Candidatus Epulopiscium viviparus]